MDKEFKAFLEERRARNLAMCEILIKAREKLELVIEKTKDRDLLDVFGDISDVITYLR